MFRMWGKIWKDNHLLKDIVIENNKEDTRTHKVFEALDEICYAFDLGKPIWLDSCVADFKKHSRACPKCKGQGLRRTALSNRLILIIWRSR